MLTLVYVVLFGKCRTIVRTAIVENSVHRISQGGMNRIIDLRSMGIDPYFEDEQGRKVRIPKRLRPSGIYNGCVPIDKGINDGFRRERTYKPTKSVHVSVKPLAESQPVKHKRMLKITSSDRNALIPASKKVIWLGLTSSDVPDSPGIDYGQTGI